MDFALTRRHMITASAIAAAGLSFPSVALAQGREKRLVFVIQRGAADGLALLQPQGDPALRSLRAQLVNDDAAMLDGFFALHPAMTQTATMFSHGEARGFHAVATGYRERSHFDGQNILETGAARPYGKRTGWLGRLLPLVSGSPGPMALLPTVPLALRGSVPVATYQTSRLPNPSDDLLMQLSTLYEEDAMLAPLWEEALRTRMLSDDIGGSNGRNGANIGSLAARLMMAPQGPRVMMIETGGWDTHQSQPNRLRNQLGGLDSLLGAMREGLAGEWRNTLVIVATEFGRTARVNGTLGTDHGTASAALMLGGSLGRGEPVIADWPGLADAQLYENRDLRPTGDLLRIATGAVADHFGIDRDRAFAALEG